jgi:hypothetical protein
VAEIDQRERPNGTWYFQVKVVGKEDDGVTGCPEFEYVNVSGKVLLSFVKLQAEILDQVGRLVRKPGCEGTDRASRERWLAVLSGLLASSRYVEWTGRRS